MTHAIQEWRLALVGAALVAAALASGCNESAPLSGLDEGVPGAHGTGGPGSIILDPGFATVLTCDAPDREEYKAAHGIVEDPDDAGPDGGIFDSETVPDGGIDGLEHTILFVFDKSGSMDGEWEDSYKWAVTSATMIQAVTTYQSYLSAGAIFFPTDDDCGVSPMYGGGQIPFTTGTEYLSAWDGMMEAYGPNGNTPLEVAFERANAAILSACRDGIMERPFKVVLLTDGEPTCDDDTDEVLEHVQTWFAHGIQTLVIGLPGSEDAVALLNSIAVAGGSEAYMPVGEPGELEDDMDAVCE